MIKEKNTQAKEYGVDLQRLFVEFLSQDQDLFARVNGILDPMYFDRELRKGVEFVQEHSMNYSALPTLRSNCSYNRTRVTATKRCR